MQLNYFGAVKLVLAFLPGMRQRGSGHIINVSSIGVQSYPHPCLCGYEERAGGALPLPGTGGGGRWSGGDQLAHAVGEGADDRAD